jgi:hypothetical protein
MSYAILAPTDKQLRSYLLESAHHWLFRCGCTQEETAEALKVYLSFQIARRNKKWYGEAEAEKGIREAPENQEWINEFVNKAIEDAQATQAVIGFRMMAASGLRFARSGAQLLRSLPAEPTQMVRAFTPVSRRCLLALEFPSEPSGIVVMSSPRWDS